jgi:uncharacterized membrane protein YidH (DUF202 family)
VSRLGTPDYELDADGWLSIARILRMTSKSRPANPGGVAVGAVGVIAIGVAIWAVDDLSENTRRGLPIGVILFGFLAAALALIVHSWLRPAREARPGEEPVSNRQVVIGSVVGVLAVAAILTLVILSQV